MDNINVIIKPLVTEKSTHQQTDAERVCVPGASRMRTSIRSSTAVEQLYDVKVDDVRTMNRKGKPRRTRFK